MRTGLFSSARLVSVVCLLLIVACLGIATPYFWTIENITNILSQATIPFILTVGAVFVIATGQIDLSVGSTLAIGALTCGAAANSSGTLLGGVLAACLTGAICGLINGLLASRIPSFIATLATMGAYRGLALVATNAESVNLRATPGLLDIQGISIFVPAALLIGACAAFTLDRTMFGLRLLAIGSNERAARNLGLSVTGYRLAAFAIAGALFGLAGSFLLFRLGAARPALGMGYELDAIAAALVGGTALSGGKASITGALMATLLFSAIRNCLTLLDVSPYYQQIAVGLLLIAVVMIQTAVGRPRGSPLENHR